MGQTVMKSNLLNSLELCVRDFSTFIEESNGENNCLDSIINAKRCREAFITCIDACESADVNSLGQLLYTSRIYCHDFLENCKTNDDPLSHKCLESCSIYLEECDNLLSD